MTQKLQELTARLIIPTLCYFLQQFYNFFQQIADSLNNLLFIGVAKTQKLVVVLDMSLSKDFKTTFKQMFLYSVLKLIRKKSLPSRTLKKVSFFNILHITKFDTSFDKIVNKTDFLTNTNQYSSIENMNNYTYWHSSAVCLLKSVQQKNFPLNNWTPTTANIN